MCLDCDHIWPKKAPMSVCICVRVGVYVWMLTKLLHQILVFLHHCVSSRSMILDSGWPVYHMFSFVCCPRLYSYCCFCICRRSPSLFWQWIPIPQVCRLLCVGAMWNNYVLYPGFLSILLCLRCVFCYV